MRIVIDYQGAQSPANGNRGIGRYTSSLVDAMAKDPRGHEILLVLNGRFPDAVDAAKAQFDGLIAAENMHVWYPPPFAPAASPGSRRACEKLCEAFVASLAPDVVFVTSLFEGLGDSSVTSIGSFAPLLTAVTLYDLIPLVHPKLFLNDPAVRGWYMRKVSALRRANMWLAISESSRQEGIDFLGLDPERCINISTAAYEHFKQIAITPDRQRDLRHRYGLHKPFIMYTGGINHRKNIEGLIRAFALLPPQLRHTHQLAIVCSAPSEDRKRLLELARREQLDDLDVVITGFVPEQDLVELYNLCSLFVFPSWHEGFGLPALEAMHCGAVVIAANTTSLPEVIGTPDALFDPRDDRAIAAKMFQALTDESLRARLVEHGLQQARTFSWKESARRAIDGLEQLQASRPKRFAVDVEPHRHRPRLAYVSPLPPERSGIASYSAELLPELAQHYEIDLITDLTAIDDPVLTASFPVRDVQWFRDNANSFDRVLYHFGNSEFHQHMFSLLEEIPGVVVLHDFYLSGIESHMEFHGNHANRWTRALYAAHGYGAIAERFQAEQVADVIFKYPCNLGVLTQAQGVIVHSPHSIELATQWYGGAIAQDWALIPHLRVPPINVEDERTSARQELGLASDDFLVCAFGLLGPTKLNHRLLEAWRASPLASDPRCRLVFVGAIDESAYSVSLAHDVKKAPRGSVSITGWASGEVFQRYLAAADLAVQLRTQSRGETSGTVLDTMSRGLATIVNANGSMASLPEEAVAMLPDDFTGDQLANLLEQLWRDASARHLLGTNARQVIRQQHAPASCARSYAEAIERFADAAALGPDGLLRSIQRTDPLREAFGSEGEMLDLADAVAATLQLPAPRRQMLIDVSELVQRNAKSGIQRVVKSLLQALLDAPPEGYRIEPVYAVKGRTGYRYARRFTLGFMNCPVHALQDAPIDFTRGDLFVGLDLQPHLVPEQRTYFRRLRHSGVRVEFVVYDLLPILLSHRFAEHAAEVHARWLAVVAENDGAVCISQAVADELTSWLRKHAPQRLAAGFAVRSFHLGADLDSAAATQGKPPDAEKALKGMSGTTSFLMVGTLEPRKGHAMALDAFEQLWAKGLDVTLVIAGKRGWMVDALAARIQRHAERGKRLIWIEQASDEYLEQLYTRASCLIAASEGEGFGLPLIEAAKHSLPILATDLPVFREVAGEHALFFKGDAASLAAAVAAWLELFRQQLHPRSDAMPHLTWRQSAAQFTEALLGVGDGVGDELMPQNTPPPSRDAFVRLAGSSHQK